MPTPEQYRAVAYRKAQEKGLLPYWSLIDYIAQREGGWQGIQSYVPDPQGPNGRENSWGPFQLLIDYHGQGGLGAGHTAAQLLDPEVQAEIALGHIAQALASGASVREAVSPWNVTKAGGDPKMESLIQASEKAPAQPGTGQGVQMSGMWQEGETTMPAQEDLYEWYAHRLGFKDRETTWRGETYQETARDQAKAYLDGLTPTERSAKENEFLAATGQAPSATAQEPMTAREQAVTESDWYTNELAKWDRLVAAKAIEPLAAAEAFQRQLDLKQEETTRYGYAQQMGKDVLGTLEERAGRTLQTPTFPGTEAGGLLSDVAGMYGLSAPPPLEGVPVSSFPNAWETYKQAMATGGLPQNLEPVGANMPTVPTYTTPPVPEQGLKPLQVATGQGVGTGGTNLTYERAQQLLAMAQRRQISQTRASTGWGPGGASMVGGLI